MHVKTPFMNNSIISISTMVAKYCKHAACFNTPATVISPDIYTLYTHDATKFLTAQIDTTSHDKMECVDYKPNHIGNNNQHKESLGLQ